MKLDQYWYLSGKITLIFEKQLKDMLARTGFSASLSPTPPHFRPHPSSLPSLLPDGNWLCWNSWMVEHKICTHILAYNVFAQLNTFPVIFSIVHILYVEKNRNIRNGQHFQFLKCLSLWQISQDGNYQVKTSLENVP